MFGGLLDRLPPPLSSLPTPVIRQITALVVINVIVWTAAGIVLHFHPALITPAVLSYTLGLRHALDADHISAIDLMTRRLIASGDQNVVSVGTWFSLGHSTIVVITCIVVAATSGALRDKFSGFQRVGNIIGTSVSAAFLLILCAGNAWVLRKLVLQLRKVLAEERRMMDVSNEEEMDAAPLEGTAQEPMTLELTGFLGSLFHKLFRLVDKPWKMYPIGVMFGLGFDTSSEVAILGIASIQGAQGTSIWLILIFPVLFTAGMCLLDTTDGALMSVLYTSKAFSRDRVAILYYSIILTGITIFVAAFIGIIQLLSLIQNVASPEGSFWDGVSVLGDNFDIVGGCICGVFVLVGVGSIIVYRSWRRKTQRSLQLPILAQN